jgi:xanthine dehydrogenase accessory factor
VSLQGEFADAARGGGRAALVTVAASERRDVNAGAKLLLRPDGTRDGTLGDPELDAAAIELADELLWAERSELHDVNGARLFVDVTAPPPRLLVFGAVDYAAALCSMAKTAGWRSFVIDPRGRFATRERFPDAEEVVAAWPADAVERLGGIDRATYLVVLTHDPKLDDAALTLALESDAPYIGAMGSRRAQEKRRDRLVAAGVPEDALGRISAPIGLDLGGLTSEETALSILAEVVAVRNGREGGRLSTASGRIHQVG